MSHKVGDIVHIRTVESICNEYKCEYGKEIINVPDDSPSGFVSDMWKYCGWKAIIRVVYNDGSYGLAPMSDDIIINYSWNDWMLEDEAERRYKNLRGLYE